MPTRRGIPTPARRVGHALAERHCRRAVAVRVFCVTVRAVAVIPLGETTTPSLLVLVGSWMISLSPDHVTVQLPMWVEGVLLVEVAQHACARRGTGVQAALHCSSQHTQKAVSCEFSVAVHFHLSRKFLAKSCGKNQTSALNAMRVM